MGFIPSGPSATYQDYSSRLQWFTNGVAPSFGNAVITARYAQMGKLVHFYGTIVFGTTSTFGTGGTMWLSLPINTAAALANGSQVNAMNVGSVFHVGAGPGSLPVILDTQSGNNNIWRMLVAPTYGATSVQVTPTVPFAWGSGDIWIWNMLYEAA